MSTSGAERPQRYLRAILDAIAPSETYGLSEADRRKVLDESTWHVIGQLADMTPELRAKAWAGLASFRLYSWMRCRKTFDALDLDERRRLIDSWSYGSWYLPRQIFRLLRGLTLLAYFEHPLIIHALVGTSGHGKDKLAVSVVHRVPHQDFRRD